MGLNPHIRFRVPTDDTRCFISLSQDDPRMTDGARTLAKQDALGFHILQDPKGGKLRAPETDAIIDGADPSVTQVPYKKHLGNELEVTLDDGDYVLVPSTYDADRPGKFFVSIYADHPIAVEGGELIAEEEEDTNTQRVFLKFKGEKPKRASLAAIKAAKAYEAARSRIVSALRDHGVSMSALKAAFEKDADGKLTFDEWSNILFGFGVSRTAVSDADFQILAGGDNVIDGGEFRHIFQAEMEANRIYTGTMDENSMQSDEAIAYGAATEIAGAPTHIVAEFNRLEGENASLREQLKRVKEEQSRMMHLMLVYGKMLGTYDGPVHSVQALVIQIPPTDPFSAKDEN